MSRQAIVENAYLKKRPRASLGRRLALTLRRDWQLWALLLPALAFFVIFCYFPMYGVQIAFRDYKAAFGITGSKWVGLKFFEKFFNSYYCGRMFANTFLLNLFGLGLALWMARHHAQPIRALTELFVQEKTTADHDELRQISTGIRQLTTRISN